MIRRTTLASILGCIALAVLAASAAAWLARQEVTASLARSTAADARIRQALLESEVARFRLLPLALADDRDVISAELAASAKSASADALNRKLEHLAEATGAAAIYLVDRKGLTLAASNWQEPGSFVGSNYAFRRYVREAVARGSGRQFALGTVSRKPGLYLAQRTAQGGAVVVKLEFDWIEDEWRQAGGITFVTNREGIVLVTSRPEWRFAATRALAPEMRALALRDSGAGSIHDRPWIQGADGLVRLAGSPSRFLLVTTEADADGWSLGLAVPASQRIAAQVRLVALAAGLVMFALSGFLAWWFLRNRHRRLRTAELEAAVTTRTTQLRHEMEQRSALEARAADLREELRLANRLATLGQVSASVAHETAQPVAAIRNYATSARLLLTRGETDEVAGNLDAIDRLAERIGVVTAQLRSFARKKASGTGEAALADVFEGAHLLLRDRLAGLDVRFPAVPADLRVVGDKVRIEQILVNLLQNAIEAQADVAAPRICVELVRDQTAGQVTITVCDNGPGIAPVIAERLFTPFATSRADGLGLGLVISQDIAAEFGGSLRLGRRSSDPELAGACFELVLRIAR